MPEQREAFAFVVETDEMNDGVDVGDVHLICMKMTKTPLKMSSKVIHRKKVTEASSIREVSPWKVKDKSAESTKVTGRSTKKVGWKSMKAAD